MQSSFTVHDMESTSEPTSPMAAAASDKRKFRTCSNCTSRIPSIDFDAHTLCIGCRHQVCDLTVYCDECRNWSDTYRSAFVKYNLTLKAKRDYKGRRRARLSGAAQSPSDQSVCDTDTEVPSLDEPLPSVQVQSDNVEYVVSQESVVSEAPSTEAGLSNILYVTSGDRFEQLASSLLSKMSELQSDRVRHPPVQSHSIVGSDSRHIVAATDYLGVSTPPQEVHLSNSINPVFRVPTAPVSDETPLPRLFASDRKVQELEKDVSATRLVISSLCDRGFQPPQSLLDSASSLSRDLEDAKRSSSELRGEIRPPPSQPGVSSHLQRFATAAPVQPGPSHPEGDPASAGPSRRRSYDSPSGSFGRSSRQGSDTPPHKRRRLSDDSSADEGKSSSSHRQRDDE